MIPTEWEEEMHRQYVMSTQQPWSWVFPLVWFFAGVCAGQILQLVW